MGALVLLVITCTSVHSMGTMAKMEKPSFFQGRESSMTLYSDYRAEVHVSNETTENLVQISQKL